MQKKLFQTLLTAAIISTPVGQAYAQGSCAVQGTQEYMNNWCMGWAGGQNQPCGNSSCAVCTFKNQNCPWCYCECVYSASCPNPSYSPDKEDMKDKRVERHQEVINKNNDVNGNASE